MGGGNSAEEGVQEVCKPPTMHLSGKQFYCDRDNCKNRICEKCVSETSAQGERFCLTCSISQSNFTSGGTKAK